MVSARVTLPCERLGLPPPPCEVSLSLVRAGGTRMGLYAHTRSGAQPALAAWVRSLGADSVHVDRGGRIVHGTFSEPPEEWHPALSSPAARMLGLRVEPSGLAVLRLTGREAAARSTLATLHESATDVKVLLGPGERSPGLTVRQAWALDQAAARGYYAVPRRVKLRTIARELGMSPAALSELLRRAEERIVRAYLAGDGAPRPVALADDAGPLPEPAQGAAPPASARLPRPRGARERAAL